MAIVVNSNVSVLSTCESTSGWSGGSGLALQDVFVRQGSWALGNKVSQGIGARNLLSLTPRDFTNKFLIVWVSVGGAADTRANGGIRLYLRDTGGSWVEQYFGSEDLTFSIDGFTPLILDPSQPATSSSGTINVAAINQVGITFKVISKSVGNNPNCFFDQVSFGSTVTVTSAIGDKPNLNHVVAADKTNAWGLFTNVAGSTLGQGRIVWGSTSTGDCDPTLSGQSINYVDRNVQPGLFGMEFVSSASGNTTPVIEGLFINAPATTPVDFLMNDTNLNVATISGLTVKGGASVRFGPNHTITNSTFDQCQTVYPNTSTFTDNQIKNSTSVHALRQAVGGAYERLTFINNDRDVLIDTAGAYEANSWQHSGSNFHVDYTGGGSSSTLAVTNGGNTNVKLESSGTISLIAEQVKIEITGIPVGLEARFKRGSYTLQHDPNITTSKASYSYTYSARRPIEVSVGGVADDGTPYERNSFKLYQESYDQSIPFSILVNPSYL